MNDLNSPFKYSKCSKCNIDITQVSYEKGRTVCKFCYNNHVLTYYKNEFGFTSSLKTDVVTQTDLSDNRDRPGCYAI